MDLPNFSFSAVSLGRSPANFLGAKLSSLSHGIFILSFIGFIVAPEILASKVIIGQSFIALLGSQPIPPHLRSSECLQATTRLSLSFEDSGLSFSSSNPPRPVQSGALFDGHPDHI